MTRAERAAEKAYPPQVVKTLRGEFDCNAYARLLFWRGYQQALVEMLEWGNEDKGYLFQAIEVLERENYLILADKLKSLLSRINAK